MKAFFSSSPRIFAQLNKTLPKNEMIQSINDTMANGSDVLRVGVTDYHGTPVIVSCGWKKSLDGQSEITDPLSLGELLSNLPECKFNFFLVDNDIRLAKTYSEIIIQKGAERRVLTSSVFGKCVKTVKGLLTDSAVSFSLMKMIGLYALYRGGIMSFLRNFSYEVIETYEMIGPSYIASHGFIRLLKAKGIRTHVYVSNNEPLIKRIWDAGADGFITEDPAFLSSWLKNVKQE